MVAQNFTGAGTAAVGKALTNLLNVSNKPGEIKETKQEELENIIMLLSEVGRILSNALFTMSKNRRALCLPYFNSAVTKKVAELSV